MKMIWNWFKDKLKNDTLFARMIVMFVIIAFILITAWILEVAKKVEKPNASLDYISEGKKDEFKELSKDEIFQLLDKGIKNSIKVDSFIYSKKVFEDNKYTSIYFGEEYSGLIDVIELLNYKSEEFKFVTQKNEMRYVWGYFENKSEEIVYIVIDKQTGRLKSLNSERLQVSVY